jgi:predicted GIY-YIG superfamily endonuclease
MPDRVVVHNEAFAEKSAAINREKQIIAWKIRKMIEA